MMFKTTLFTALAAATMLLSSHAGAVVLINGATQGLYNSGIGDLATDAFMNNAANNGTGGTRMFLGANGDQGDPTTTYPTAPDFSGASAGIQTALGNWLTTPAAPGGSWSGGPQPIPATWAINDETAIIYTLSSASGLTGVVASIGVDNGVFVWLDGVYQFGATAPGVATPGEYIIALGDLTAGTHYLQVLRADHGGSTGWSIEVTGDVVSTVDGVPAPASLALLGAALTGLGLARRRS